jgi:hypothetical protein
MPKRTVVIAMLAIATITAVLVWQRNRAPQDPKGESAGFRHHVCFGFLSVARFRKTLP